MDKVRNFDEYLMVMLTCGFSLTFFKQLSLEEMKERILERVTLPITDPFRTFMHRR